MAVEAEPGRIEGGEDGVADTAELAGMLTTPEEAREFADTGIDWLAPSFGNIHGKYPAGGPSLDFHLLRDIKNTVGEEVRLVLHGTDGFGEGEYGMCVRGGVSKVNVNRCVNEVFLREVRKGASLSEGIERGVVGMEEVVGEVMGWCGSVGRA